MSLYTFSAVGKSVGRFIYPKRIRVVGDILKIPRNLKEQIKEAVEGEMDYLDEVLNDRLWEVVRPILEKAGLEKDDGIIEDEEEYLYFARDVFFNEEGFEYEND